MFCNSILVVKHEALSLSYKDSYLLDEEMCFCYMFLTISFICYIYINAKAPKLILKVLIILFLPFHNCIICTDLYKVFVLCCKTAT